MSSMALFQWSPPNAGVVQPPLTESRSCRNQREAGLGLVRGGPWHQPRPEPTTRSTRGSRSLSREVAGGLVTAIVVSLLMKTVLVQAFFIPSASMGQPFMDARVAPVTGARQQGDHPPGWPAPRRHRGVPRLRRLARHRFLDALAARLRTGRARAHWPGARDQQERPHQVHHRRRGRHRSRAAESTSTGPCSTSPTSSPAKAPPISTFG